MIWTADLRTGISILLNGRLYEVVEADHVKPGKGAAFVRTRLRDMETGSLMSQTFKGEQKVEQAIVTERKMEYLYRAGDLYYFMDTSSYEQVSLPESQVQHMVSYLKENCEVTFRMYKDRIVGVSLPDTVVLRVAQTGPGVRGDTATGGSKPATLETGVTIQVPLFVNTGDAVKVDTRSGQYLVRV